MTQPPGDGHDPNRPHPSTRAFEPADNPAEYPESAAQPQSPAPGSVSPSGYGAVPPTGSGPGAPGYPPGGSGGGRRTLFLVLTVIGALVVLVVVAALIFGGSGHDTPSSSPTTTTTVSATTRSTTVPTTTRETTTEQTTRSTAAPGSVVYQLTGGGDVVGVRYRRGGDFAFDPVTSAPWSVSTSVDGSSAELTAIVVRGPVTCTIMQGGQLLASATSNGGLLRCAADLG